jgi:hypothetical protein
MQRRGKRGEGGDRETQRGRGKERKDGVRAGKGENGDEGGVEPCMWTMAKTVQNKTAWHLFL